MKLALVLLQDSAIVLCIMSFFKSIPPITMSIDLVPYLRFKSLFFSFLSED